MDVQSYNLNASIYLDLLQNKLSDQAKKAEYFYLFLPPYLKKAIELVVVKSCTIRIILCSRCFFLSMALGWT